MWILGLKSTLTCTIRNSVLCATKVLAYRTPWIQLCIVELFNLLMRMISQQHQDQIINKHHSLNGIPWCLECWSLKFVYAPLNHFHEKSKFHFDTSFEQDFFEAEYQSDMQTLPGAKQSDFCTYTMGITLHRQGTETKINFQRNCQSAELQFNGTLMHCWCLK